MDDMRQEIESAIAKNMPGMVGSKLKKLLEKGEADAKQLQGALEANLYLSKEVKELSTSKVALEYRVKEMKAREDSIEAREKAVTVRETKIEVMEVKIAAAEYSRDSILMLTEIAFKNPRLTYTESGNIPVSGGVGIGPQTMYMSKTTTVEESKL